MRLRLMRVLSALPLLVGLAQGAAADEAPTPALSNMVDLKYDVEADGQYTALVHIQRTAGTTDATRSLNVFPWEYSPSREKVEVVAAYTLKANGDKLPVKLSDIRDQDQPAANTDQPPTDSRAKLIPFFNLGSGDSIVVDLRARTFKPRLPGVFSLALLYDRSQAWDARVSVTVPYSMTLHADAVGLKVIDDGGDQTYTWRYRSPPIASDGAGALAPIERLPRLIVTTAADWQQIGHIFATLALPQAAVTPQVRQVADKAATGVTEPRDVATQLFAWVRDNIRYQPVPLGQGKVVPQTADATLVGRSGDSGDEAVLLMALLAAKGIVSELVLIDSDNVYHLGVPAPFAQLNHVMLYLPAFSAYADPTVSSARIGLLPFNEYGKPVIHAVTSGTVEHTTPVLAPNVATLGYTTTAHITPNGMIEGDSGTVATGPFAVSLLLAARVIQAQGAEKVGTSELHSVGEIGSGRYHLPPRLTGNGGESMLSDFSVSLWPHLSADQRLLMPDGLRIQPHTGDMLIGPLGVPLPDDAPTPCFAGRETDTISLDVGPAYRVTELPTDRTITAAAFSYVSHWTVEGSTVTVRRELVSRVATPLCEGPMRKAAAAALRAIAQDYGARIRLAQVPPAEAKPQGPSPGKAGSK